MLSRKFVIIQKLDSYFFHGFCFMSRHPSCTESWLERAKNPIATHGIYRLIYYICRRYFMLFEGKGVTR